jgi:hypothetical protein
MAIDIREISLTDEQKRRIAELAEQSGRPWREVLEEKFSSLSQLELECDRRYKDRYIRDRNARRAYFHEWVARQTSHNPNFDDSRESIYP